MRRSLSVASLARRVTHRGHVCGLGIPAGGLPVRFVRMAAVLLLAVCLIDAVQDCAISDSLDLLDDDHHDQFSALISAPLLFGESYLLIHSAKLHFALSCSPRFMCQPIRQ